MKRILTALLLWALGGPAAAAPPAGFIDEELALGTADGTRITALLRRPQAQDGPLPAIILFGGFRSAAEVLDMLESDAPVIRASFPYPWQQPRKVHPGNVLGVIEDFGLAAERTFSGIRALVRALRARPEVDPQRLVIAGASAGAPFATIGAAQNGVPGLIVVQGYGDIVSVIARQFDLSLAPKYGAWVRWPSRWLAAFCVWYLDLPQPEAFAARLRPGQQAFMVTATDDERIPQAATEILWNALQGSGARVERLDLPGGHLRGAGDEKIGEILAHALAWMQRVGFLDPSGTGP